MKSRMLVTLLKKRIEKEILIKAIKMLPDEQRALIVLRDIRGFTYWEIADMLKLKLGTVKSKISRARSQLKQLLEIQGYKYYFDDELLPFGEGVTPNYNFSTSGDHILKVVAEDASVYKKCQIHKLFHFRYFPKQLFLTPNNHEKH